MACCQLFVIVSHKGKCSLARLVVERIAQEMCHFAFSSLNGFTRRVCSALSGARFLIVHQLVTQLVSESSVQEKITELHMGTVAFAASNMQVLTLQNGWIVQLGIS